MSPLSHCVIEKESTIPPPQNMKRTALIKHIKKHEAVLIREGRRHSIYQRGEYKTQVTRHTEIVDELARNDMQRSKHSIFEVNK